MNKQNGEKSRISLKDNKCIWMEGGVLNYHLCSLDYRCEDCELDKVIKGEYSQAPSAESDLSYPEVKSFNFEEIIADVNLSHRYDYFLIRMLYNYFSSILYSSEVKYFPSHFWVYELEGGSVRIGLDDFIVKYLDPIENIIFPVNGNRIQEGAAICWLFGDDWNIRLSAPLAGSISASNRRILQQAPELLKKDPYGRGWLLEIKPNCDTSALSLVENIGSIKQWYNQCLLEIYFSASELIDKVGAFPGVTMSDGGVAVTRLRQLLGKENYTKLAKKLLKK